MTLLVPALLTVEEAEDGLGVDEGEDVGDGDNGGDVEKEDGDISTPATIR